MGPGHGTGTGCVVHRRGTAASRPGFQHSYPTLAPDLAVEVLSPSERPGARREKMQDYFAAGTRLVWEIDPAQRTITVYRSAHDGTTLAATDELSGAEVLPGFACRVGELIP